MLIGEKIVQPST